MQDRPILYLTPRWRIATDYELQWILQRRRRGGKRWDGIHFCTTRQAVARVIREELGDEVAQIDASALHRLNTWPEHFVDWLKELNDGQIETERARAA